MQQKAQLIATLIHEPEIIIIDEPFAALDPVNTQLVKDLLIELRNQGRTIIMCTHQMNQVEQLCDRLVLVDEGKVLLSGSLKEVRERFSSNQVLLQIEGDLPESLPEIEKIEKQGLYLRLTLKDGTDPQELLKHLIERGVKVDSFEIATPTLDEIFISVVKQGKNGYEEDN